MALKSTPGTLRLRSTGNEQAALAIARRAAEEVPAYQRLLKKTGHLPSLFSGRFNFKDLPQTNKTTYCLSSALKDLRPTTVDEKVNGFFFSSGSSGRPFCWPRIKGAKSSFLLTDWLQETFQTKGKSVLTVVALNMDGWTAGINTALTLERYAQESPHRFMVSFPGSDYEQALRLIESAERETDKILVFIYPVAIPYFLRLAKDLKIKLPLQKLRFATTGDPFTESFRKYLDRLCSASWPDTAMASYAYSSGDTRVIGAETRISRALTRLLYSSPALKKAFGITKALPNLYAAKLSSDLPFIEEEGGELLFTKWQAIPLVRYNLRDKGEIWSLPEIRRLVLQTPLPEALKPLQNEFSTEADGEDIIALYGRSKSVYFYGLYLDEQIFSNLLRRRELSSFKPGLVQITPTGSGLDTRLVWDIEVNAPTAKNSDKFFYNALIAGLISAYPHFEVNYRNFLSKWDENPEKRVFKINLHPYPTLSRKLRRSRKHTVIRLQE